MPPYRSDGDNALHFEEFMSVTEGGSIGFGDFLDNVKMTANLNRVSLAERNRAMESYNEEAAAGFALNEPPAPAGPAQVAPAPTLPPGVQRVQCYACSKPFGVPTGAKMAQCPHCISINSVAQ